jgi:predicted porin
MKLTKLFLGTTALLSAGVLAVGVSRPAASAEVLPGGALDITITGFARFLASGGDISDARLDNTFSDDLDFSNDTEVHVLARGKHETTGIEYGATVEFEADTNRTDNTDETWVFLRGGFGEVRLGDEDGPVDNSQVGGNTIGAGTGGIDGSVVDTIATGVVKPFNSGDDTKIRYYTPEFGGFQVGVSYTPNSDGGDQLATKDEDWEDLFEGALTYKGDFGGFGILASLIGSIGDNKVGGDDELYTYGAGVATELFGLKVAGGYFDEKVGAEEKTFFNAGVGYGYGPMNLSLTYGQVIDSNDLTGGADGQELDEPYNLVLSADIGLMPGVVLAGDVGWFDNDASGDGETDDNGWQAVGRLGVAF